MNLATPNSGGSASTAPPRPPIEIKILLPDGSCIPATPANARKLLKQARSAALKARKARRQEIADELQRNLEDRRAARRLLDELAGYERDRRRIAVVLRARVKPEKPAAQASTVTKRRTVIRTGLASTTRPASSWVVDDLGLRGIHYHQSYLSRKSPSFYRGAATDRWRYDVRDEAVVRDADGNVVWFSNLGEDIDEIAAAWQAIEDATTRKNGKVQIRIIVPLDADAAPEEQAAALRHFCEAVLKPLDLPYSAVMHRAPEGGDQRNAHGHILTNLRPIERVAPYSWGFADEVRSELDGRNGVQMLRHLWAWSMTEAAEGAGRTMQYTGLSYAARGLSLEGGEHLGEDRTAMVARGERVWVHERNRLKSARNAQRMILRDLDRKMAALTQLRDTLIGNRQRVEAPRRLLVAAPSKDSGAKPLRRSPISGVPHTALTPAGQPAPAKTLTSASPTAPMPTRLTPASDPQPRRDVLQASRGRVTPARLEAVHPTASSGIGRRLFPATGSKRDGTADLLASASSRQPVSQPAAIVETMQEMLRLFAQRRSARRRDPALAAWHRRRALAEAELVAASTQPVPGRLWFELNPLTRSTPASRKRSRDIDRERLTRIAAGGGYVSRCPDGVLVQAVWAPGEPAPEHDWWSQAHIQRPLADLHGRQQQVMAKALRASRITPERLGRGKAAPWTVEVSAGDRERLGRWAESAAFHDDLGRLSRSLAARAVGSAARAQDDVRSLVVPPDRIPDGFGGWRDTPAPAHVAAGSPVRLKAFDAAGKPTDHLLRLLNLAARHPRAIGFATDSRLTVEGKPPAMLAPLLHGWRHDPVVERLVVDTVKLSRETGVPAWPVEIAAAVRRFEAKDAGQVTPPPRDPGRDRQM